MLNPEQLVTEGRGTLESLETRAVVNVFGMEGGKASSMMVRQGRHRASRPETTNPGSYGHHSAVQGAQARL